MFKEYKLRARKALAENYKLLIIPCTLFMLSNFMIRIIINRVTTMTEWSDFDDSARLWVVLFLLLCEFVFIPVSLAYIYKTIVVMDKSKGEKKHKVKKTFSLSSVLKIIAINFIPSFLSFFSDINSDKHSELRIFEMNTLFSAVLLIVSIYTGYKFYAVNFCFALNETSVKQTVVDSFKIMKNNFGKWVKFLLSFSPWILLVVAVNILIRLIICAMNYSPLTDFYKLYVPIIDAFSSFGYGIYLYYLPYLYLSAFYFLNDRLQKIKT